MHLRLQSFKPTPLDFNKLTTHKPSIEQDSYADIISQATPKD